MLEDSMWAGWNLIELNYAADNRAYQVRSLEQLEKISDDYDGYTFNQTMNISTGEIDGDYLIEHMPENASLNGKGSHFDFNSENYDKMVEPDAPYTIDINISNAVGTNVYSKNAGLFGRNLGTLKNVNITGRISIRYDTVENLFYLGALTGSNSGIVENCVSQATVDIIPENLSGNKTSVGTAAIGGLIGYNSNICRFSDVKNTDILCGSSIHSKRDGNIYIGGLIGSSDGVCEFNNVRNIKILDAGSEIYNKNNSNCNAYIGGLVGYAGSGITGCQVLADICNGTSFDQKVKEYVGGLIGATGSGGTMSVTMCGFKGSVDAPNTNINIGQLVGAVNNNCSFVNCCGWADNTALQFKGVGGGTYSSCVVRANSYGGGSPVRMNNTDDAIAYLNGSVPYSQYQRYNDEGPEIRKVS